jgi:phage-related protein
MKDERIKPVRWIGSSRKDVRSFPRPVRLEIGQAIFAAQSGETDPSAKSLTGFGGRKVMEHVARGGARLNLHVANLAAAGHHN